jgi:hypothetical protein
MRHALRFLPLLALLVISSQADARGGGGFGFHGGGFGFHGTAAMRFHQRVPFAARRLGLLRFNNHALNNRSSLGLNDAGILWPDGGWWPDGGGYYQTVAPPPSQPVQPQVIVIHTDGSGTMKTTEATPDVSYVAGCRAIANGYHCDTSGATR